jgi:serine/arginine repetitive matrix protein 2
MDSRRITRPPQKTIAQRNSNLADINELERTDSRGSTNFSYPLSARPNSPPPKSSPLMQSRWAPGQSQNGLSPQEAETARQNVYDSSQQPVKKKKKKIVRGAAEGSHLSGGTMGVRTNVAPQEMPSPRAEPIARAEDGQQTPPAKKKKKKVVTSPQDSDVHARPMSPAYSSDSDTTPEKVMKRAQRASGTLNKQPSVVREDWEGEQGGNAQGTPTTDPRVTTLSPAGSPAAAVKSTQPSTAANMSRKIDEVPMEPKPVGQYAPTLAVDVPTPILNMPASSAPQPAGKGYLEVGRSTSQGSRQTSLSPSRSKTRFSANLSSDLSAERKHEPLPRSVSPAKSAMKHHSPSQRESPIDTIVPGAWQRTSTTPSEASDNTSMASEPGLTTVTKKKKSARVTFGEGAEIVGVSQTAPSDSPILASPQHKDPPKKGWFGLGKSKSPLGTIPAEDDMEEVMKPRPVLPSFGSVRGKSRSSDVPEQKTPSATFHDSVTVPSLSDRYHNTTMPSSSEASIASIVPTDTSASSDHAIGSIIAQHNAQNRLPNGVHDKTLTQPLPPVVTSVEGTGYASDTSESTYGEDETPHHFVEEQPQVTHPTITDTTNAGENVPTIAVQPATPAIEQTEQDDLFVSLPGGFPVSAETLGPPSRGQNPEQDSSQITSAGLGIAEPGPQEQVAGHQPASSTGKSLSDALRQRDQEDSDRESTAGDSIYSDAEEDLSYMDGDGFGSINAIMESPVVKSPANRITTPPESPIARIPPSRNAKPGAGSRTESWEQAQAHWSEVAQRRRQEKEQTADSNSQPELSQPPKPKTKKKKKHLNIAAGEIAPEVLASMNSRQMSTQQPAPYPAAGSGRDGPADRGAAPVRTSKRTTMKAEPEVEDSPQFRRSMRSGSPSAVATEPQRPVETPQRTSKLKGTLQKKHLPSTAGGLAAADAGDARTYGKQQKMAAQPNQSSRSSRAAPLQRTFSNGSDSSSSFRKRRKGTAASDGKYTMKRSMRGGQSTEARQPVQPTPPQPAGRGGIRSLSPANRRPFSGAGGQSTMRSSMRASVDSGPQTLRNQEGHQRSSSAFAGFGKSRPKSATVPAGRALPSKIKSRFADSDDEDAANPKIFNSRFEDSSDEEPEPDKLRPVRGIPRKIDEGDSTDLEDSSDIEKEIEKSQAVAQPALAVNASEENGVVKASDAPQSLTKEKKSFFGRFRSKKDKDKNPRMSRAAVESSLQTQAYLGQARAEMERAKSPEIGKENGPEVERTKSAEPSMPKSPSSPAPERQRRLTPHRVMSDQFVPQRIPSESWPLPPKVGAADEDRPYTADGVANASAPVIAGREYRPGMPQRHNTASTERTAGGTPVYSEKTGRKKRFPKLRKAFGLYD